jgi:hypothetical protein
LVKVKKNIEDCYFWFDNSYKLIGFLYSYFEVPNNMLNQSVAQSHEWHFCINISAIWKERTHGFWPS